MSAVKNIFSPPKPKTDKDAERRLKEQLDNEKKKAEAADRALASSRRARLGRGMSRTGLAYAAPSTQPGSQLG